MKIKLSFIAILVSLSAQSQPVSSTGNVACTGFSEPFYWSRLNDSRAEAMGQTVVTTSNNSNTSFYNPAALGTLEGIQVSGTYATPYYALPDAGFLYTSAAGKINDYIKVQLSRFAFSGNQDLTFIDNTGNVFQSAQKVTAYTLGIGSQPFENWFFGANLKLMEISLLEGEKAYTLLGDVGMIKRFQLTEHKGHHQVDVGFSVMNFTNDDLNYKALDQFFNDSQDAPCNLMIGFTYGFASYNKQVKEKLDLIQAKVQGNYINQLDLDVRQGFRFGAELGIAEILYLRAGYYHQTTCNFGFTQYNRSHIASFTYGGGLQLPLDQLTEVPLAINLDFAHIPQPSYIYNVDKEDPFTSVNLRVGWKL